MASPGGGGYKRNQRWRNSKSASAYSSNSDSSSGDEGARMRSRSTHTYQSVTSERTEGTMDKRQMQGVSRRNDSDHEECANRMSGGKYNLDDDVIKINIKGVKDQKYPIHIGVSRTVLEMRQYIESSYGPMSANTQFLYTGKKMEDSKTLKHYNVQQDYVIIMTGIFIEDNYQPTSVDPQRENQQVETTKPKKYNSIYPSLPISEALTDDDENHKNGFENEYGSENDTLADKKQSHKRHQRIKAENKPNITVEDLVSTLANSEKFILRLEDIIEDYDVKPSLIKKLIRGEPQTFTFESDIVTLKPSTPLCTDYINNWCIGKKDCTSLHICGEFLAETCSSKLCLFGHNWFTDHNTAVLRNFNINHLSADLISKLIKQSVMSKTQEKSAIEICTAYNSGSCTQRNCHFLHICFDLVNNRRGCKSSRCKLNHNILDDSCIEILRAAGISTNETPADILDALSDVLQIDEDHFRGDSIQTETDNKSQQKELALGSKSNHTQSNHASRNSVPNRNYNKQNGDTDDSLNSPNSMNYPASSSSPSQKMSSSSTYETDYSATLRSTNSEAYLRTFSSSNSINPTTLRDPKSNVYSTTQDNSFKTQDSSSYNMGNPVSPRNSSTSSSATNSTQRESSSSTYNPDYSTTMRSTNSETYSRTVSSSNRDPKSNVYSKTKNNSFKSPNSSSYIMGNPLSSRNSSTSSSTTNSPFAKSLSSQYGYNDQPTTTSQSNNGAVGNGHKRIVDTASELGNTEIPEICYYSVIGKCKFDGNGCRRLHSIYHYHWQVQKDSGIWLNLQSHQVEFLEKNYCNPAYDTTVLPDLKKNYTSEPSNQLLALLGYKSWKVDFQKMRISNLFISKHKIRRLTSENVVSYPVSSNTFVWYFQEETGRWIEYGKVNSLGKQQLKSMISSKDIEREYITYQTNRNKNVMMFNNAMFNYIIDFDAMTQTNTKSNVKRSIRRRPEFRN